MERSNISSMAASAVALMVLFAWVSAAHAATSSGGCTDVVTGYSATYGKRDATKLERYANQKGQFSTKGRMSRLAMYYDTATKCIVGIKVSYGAIVSANTALIGVNTSTLATVTLNAGESIVKAQAKAGGACVEYVKLTTDANRTLALGNSASPAPLKTSFPNAKTGFLGTVRGYEEYVRGAGTATVRGPMRTLQFVWANCTGAVASPAAAAAAAAAAVVPPSPSPVVAAPVLAPASPSPSPAVAAAEAAATSAACPANKLMCDESASITSAAYCGPQPPFVSAACIGGCCFSAGKCTSSSCAISGVGREVPNTICYGLNKAGGAGFSQVCTGLACKLAVPGCTSDLLGGTCVGTVVDLSGTAMVSNPSGAALVGYPCLDVSPSNSAITAAGLKSVTGPYVATLWSVCDCHIGADAAAVAAAAAAATADAATSPLAQLSQLNFTDTTVLLDALLHPGATIAAAVKSAVPGVVLPPMPATNATRALALIGALIGGNKTAASTAGTPTGALVNVVRGVSAVASAANSTNPLGALLGALAPKTPSNATNPLAGLARLVAALSPANAATTQKATVLSKILSALSAGSGASPASDLVGIVAKLISASLDGGAATTTNTGTTQAASTTTTASNATAAAPASPVKLVADALTALSKLKAPANATDLVRQVTAAVAEAKKATTGPVDLVGIVNKAQLFASAVKGASTGNLTAAGNAFTMALSALQSLSSAGPSSTSSTAAPASPPPAAAATKANTTASPAPAATTLSSLKNALNTATRVATLARALSTGSSSPSAAGSSTAAAVSPAAAALDVVATLLGGGGGGASAGGLDLASLGKLATQFGPLLQALGGSAATSAASPAIVIGMLANALSSGAGATSAGAGTSITELVAAASKLGPVLSALSAATGAGGGGAAGAGNFGPVITTVQAFLDELVS